MRVFVVVVFDWMEKLKVMMKVRRGCLFCQVKNSNQEIGDERGIKLTRSQ